ncbi:SPW repeat protein [Halopiger goleimassiliensis]|uniref:SPW repeat protein n=1 Tax=Halopiger goleimassiliensis TaxID=1293048 RepID=UPI0006783218|nr:SPW repeat protein [Halopiger goleimassiliensis]
MSEPTSDPGETRTREQGEPNGQLWLSGIVSVIGLWITVSPFVYETAATIEWNNWIVGAAIFLLAGYNFYRIYTAHPTSAGVMSLVALLGLWAIVAPFAIDGQFAIDGLEAAAQGLVWSNIVSGLLSALLAAYVTYAAGSEVRTGAPTGTR